MSTLERFIFSSLPTGMANVPGKHFQGIPWATGKVRIVDYINTCPPEENGKSLSDVTQLIWPGFFMENLSGLNYNYIIPKKVSTNASRMPPFRQDFTGLLIHGFRMRAVSSSCGHQQIPIVRYTFSVQEQISVSTLQRFLPKRRLQPRKRRSLSTCTARR